jgi:hypothetical protein
MNSTSTQPPPLDKYFLRVLPTSLLPAQQVKLSPRADHVLITSEGNDPVLTIPRLAVTPASRFAIRLDIAPPAATTLELFYLTEKDPRFSSRHAVEAPLKAGRNVIIVEIKDPDFNGVLRLDPGTLPGEYRLYSMEIFSSGPVKGLNLARSQSDLAAAFASSRNVLFDGAKADELTKLRPLRAELIKQAQGLLIKASGSDPALLLPQVHEAFIAKVGLMSPASTKMQLFYLPPDKTDYDEAHSLVQPLKPGKNVIYFELDQPDFTGTLRLDPGDVPGEYLLESLELRRAVPMP